jgi:hypothetical protein
MRNISTAYSFVAMYCIPYHAFFCLISFHIDRDMLYVSAYSLLVCAVCTVCRSMPVNTTYFMTLVTLLLRHTTPLPLADRIIFVTKENP